METVIFTIGNDDKIKETLVDNTGGASNIAVLNLEDKDVILAANRQVAEMAIYEVTK